MQHQANCSALYQHQHGTLDRIRKGDGEGNEEVDKMYQWGRGRGRPFSAGNEICLVEFQVIYQLEGMEASLSAANM